jgi:hypothetical protein
LKFERSFSNKSGQINHVIERFAPTDAAQDAPKFGSWGDERSSGAGREQADAFTSCSCAARTGAAGYDVAAGVAARTGAADCGVAACVAPF